MPTGSRRQAPSASSALTVLSVLSVLTFPSALSAQQRRPIGIDEFVTMPIVGDPQLSPDGERVAYTVSTASLQDNRNISRIWVVELATGKSVQLTMGPGSDRAPRWSPDGRSLAFISTRAGGPQIWRLPLGGGEATKLTSFPSGISEFIWAPDGLAFYFVSDVPWPDTTEAARRGGPYPTDALIFTTLFYRHWNEWRSGVRTHVFQATAADGSVTDLTPIDRDVPPIALGGKDLAVSPLGTELAVVYNPDSVVATSTNNDVFLMGVDGSGRQSISGNPANDNSPAYSPDGRYVAYLAMRTPGFEADRQEIVLFERDNSKRTTLTPDWNLSVGAITWMPDSKALVAQVEERGVTALYRVDLGGKRTRLVIGGDNSSVSVTPKGDRLIFLHSTAIRPPEIWTAKSDGSEPTPLTHLDDAAMAGLDVWPLESFGFVGARGDSVFGWTMKPPGFDSTKRYPLIYLVHGGPQGAWLNEWHARWNYALFASRGYVLAAVNFHGSTGYGQEFTNAISQHWGDYPFEDLMKGLDVVAALPYVDSTRMGAAGASYGGYMIYWMEGHTSRFRTLIAHDGVYNPLSMSGSTEELWFTTHEFGGSQVTADGRTTMERWSPAASMPQWRTPMLIVQGQLDYRIDLSEALQAYTALQLLGVPAKFLYFPDEGHWVGKPRNRRLWWGTVLDWMDQYLK